MHLNGDADLVGQTLQIVFPQADAIAVGAAAVGGDNESSGLAVTSTPISCHQRRIVWTAKAAISWVTPMLTQPALLARS